MYATIYRLLSEPKKEVTVFKGLKGLVTLGETAEKLAMAGNEADITNVVQVAGMSEAVASAWQLSEAGDAILLSPACASWDQYKNFELRGDDFVKEIKQIVSR